MTTPRQIEANRQNALRSTGPRTEAGKARSSLNALKHGAYSKDLLTPDEQNADLAGLKSNYLAHYLPSTELEKEQVQMLAALDWRLRRCGRMEAEILAAHGYERDSGEGGEEISFAGAGWGFTHDSKKARSLPALSQVEDRIFRHYLVLKKDLDKALVRRAPNGTSGAVDVDAGGSSPMKAAEHSSRA